MSVLNNPRVTRDSAEAYQVAISHGRYLVEFDDRDGLWWAFDDTGIRIGSTRGVDPLACSSDACSGWDTAEELVAVLLGFDGEAVPS